MSSSTLTTKDYDHVDHLLKEGRKTELENWIIAHEAIEQTLLLEYYHKQR